MLLLAFAPMLLQAAPASSAPAPSISPPACSTPAHDAFDLWVGEWDVFPAGRDTQVGTSKIERVSGGCAIRESWMPTRGGTGASLSMVNHNTGRWQQVWIGSDGTRVDFTGGPIAGKMVLTGYWEDVAGPGQDALVRMTYSTLDDGNVRQFGEASSDNGLSWQTIFDFIYRPKDRNSQ